MWSLGSIRSGDALNTVVPWAINLVLRLAGHDVQGGDVGI